MARKTSKKIAAQLTAGTFAQHVSDYTDHMRYEDRAASLAQTFATEGLDELDQALSTLEVQPEPALDLAQELEDLVSETVAANDVDFRALMLSHDELMVQGMTTQITAAIDARSAFETEKHGSAHNIHKTLNKVRKALMWKDTSRVMLAANVDPAFINRTLHDGSRYNVYAVDKVADAVKGLADGVVSNAINRACMVSLFQMRKAGIPFTGEIAKACASDKVHVDLAIRKHLLRHTVSASTAPTQASSTMQALETLGVVRREGSSRNPTFTLTDAPITKRLEEVLFAYAA
ncbi:hypothetical protein [Methylobacterium oryzae]|uniref:hypothetical protein n=1 Tax=Methylobacterium oryzae TaxID=334852 RepID=UPI001F2452D7|nr:hypothetical protein [Methylobacterium oryzae]UIN38402.1 hypothetical protein LXM90_30940 [Methylobacterium oryzae]